MNEAGIYQTWTENTVQREKQHLSVTVSSVTDVQSLDTFKDFFFLCAIFILASIIVLFKELLNHFGNHI